MNILKVILLISVLTIAELRSAEDEKPHPGTYLIVAPRTIRPTLPYSISVNILDSKNPIMLELSILDDKNKTIAHSQGLSERDFKPGQAKTVSFERLPATLTADGKCRLYAKGKHATSGKVLFEQNDELTVSDKSRSTFIQTDKAIYKPGSKVHFRIVAVSPDLKPIKGKANIQISDPNQNVIKQFLDQPLEGGVLGKNEKLSLQLSDEPPLGEWKITADIGGQKTEKTFTVDKYVLPKFEVTVNPPPYIGLKDDLPVNVTAKYTYGKGVVGKVTVEVKVPWYYFPRRTEEPFVPGKEPTSPSFSKTVDMDSSGETTVLFTNAELRERKMLSDDATTQYSMSMELTASATEKFTNTQRNATGSVTAYKHVEVVKIDKQADTFKPGLDYNVTISVTTPDDKPLPSAANKDIFLTIAYLQPYVPPVEEKTTTAAPNQTTTMAVYDIVGSGPSGETVTEEKRKLGPDGTVLLVLKPPLNCTSLRLEARYGSNTSEISASAYSDAAKSPTHSYLQLLSKTPTVKAGESMSFTIRTTKIVRSVTVQVMSKGYIILSKNVELSGQTGQITFPSTNEMAPKSRVIAYAIRPDNKEILVDAMDFRVEGLFKNNVSISVEPKRAEPNQTVTFTVKAAPSSYIALLSVDQSVLLLKSGNDITSEQIESDIASYDTGSYYPGWRPWGGGIERRKKRSAIWCRWCWWNIGGQDAASVFENSGVIVLTDAYLYRQPPPPARGRGGGKGKHSRDLDRGEQEEREAGGEDEKADKDSSANTQTKKGETAHPSVRRRFPETWIWVDSSTRPRTRWQEETVRGLGQE